MMADTLRGQEPSPDATFGTRSHPPPRARRHPGGLSAGFAGTAPRRATDAPQPRHGHGQSRPPRPPALPFGPLDQVVRHAKWHRSRRQCSVTSSKAGG